MIRFVLTDCTWIAFQFLIFISYDMKDSDTYTKNENLLRKIFLLLDIHSQQK